MLTCNAWKRIPSLTSNHENFPKLAPSPLFCNKDKKQHTENGSNDSTADEASLLPPSIGTNQTELTDECMEILASLQDSFAKQLQLIKDANDAKVKNMETCINQAEAAYNAAQQAILGKFQTISEKYTEVLDSFSRLGNEYHTAKLVQDKCHLATQQQIGTMIQLLLSINNSLATGQKAEVITQDQVHSIMESTQPTEQEQGTGAPGSEAERSLTTQNVSGHVSLDVR
jgi:hypothetical protein